MAIRIMQTHTIVPFVLAAKAASTYRLKTQLRLLSVSETIEQTFEFYSST